MIFNMHKLNDLLRLAITATVILIATGTSFSQVKIGNNPGIIDPASILEMESDSLVMVLPRMTTGDRAAIPNPYPGAMIYNTTLSCIEANVGSKATPDWQCLADENDIDSTGHNITFDINAAQDSITITDAGGTLGILITDLVGALNTQGGIVADTANVVDWNDLINMPSDMQNNDQYVTPSSSYNNATDSLDLVISNGGTDFSIDLSDLASDDDVTTEIGDTATALRNLITASTAADLDTDPTNEENSSFTINGTGTSDSLTITDSGGNKSVDLGALVTAMDDDGLATDSEVSSAISASDAADLDKDATNELNSDFSINGSGDSILITDAGGPIAIALSDLVTAMDDDGLATDGALIDTASAIRLYIDTQVAASSGTDLDQVTGNEYNTDMSISGSGTGDSLTVTDPGGVEGVDLGDLVTAMDDDGLATDTDVTTEIGDTATALRSLINASTAADLDTDPTNEQNTSFTINGTGDSLSIIDSGGTKSVDLGTLVTAMDDDGLATDTNLSDSTAQVRAALAASDAADLDMDASNEYNTTFEVNGSEDSLSITDGGGTLSIALDSLVDVMDDHGLATDTNLADSTAQIRSEIAASTAADLDTDPTNEENASFTINGTGTSDSLSVTDSGGTKSVDLGDLVTAMDDDGLATDSEVTSAISASDAADLDMDPTNEENASFTINGTGTSDSLSVTDSGGTKSVDLGDLVTAMDDDGLATDSEVTSAISASDAADLDMDPTNEENASFTINGTGTSDSLSVTDSGGTKSVDLGDLVTAMDDDGLATDTELADSTAQIRSEIAASTAADLDTDPTNEENASFTINGAGTSDSLSVTDSGGTKSVDLGDLVTAMDDDGLTTDTELADSTAQIRSALAASDAADLDMDASNEHNTGFAINSTEDSLTISDSGSTLAISLDSLVKVMDDDGLATDGELIDTAAAIRMYVDDSEDHLGIFDQTLIANREIISAGFDLRVTGTGRVGIGDTPIPTNSKLFVDGLISSSSDRRLKTDIVDLKYGLDEILSVNAVAYTWKDPAKAQMEGTQLGFIAQEVNELMPELVRGVESKDTYLSMTYDRFAPVLVNAIKELNTELEAVKKELAKANESNAALKAENKDKEDKFAHLMSELDQIKAALGLDKSISTKEVGEE